MSRTPNRRTILKSAAAGTAAAAVAPLPGRRSAAGPNVLLIVTDQQHARTIAAGGCRHAATPALDRLAERGVSFDRCYSTNPLCSPARSSIFSGRMPSETGVPVNGKPIRNGMPNLGQWLGDRAGYETVYCGKWHLPRGFTHRIPGFTVPAAGLGGQGNFGDGSIAAAAEGYLRNRGTGARPFFLVASFLQPHDICEFLRLNLENRDRLRYPDIADRLPPLPDNFDPPAGEPEAVRRRRERCEPARGNWRELHWRYYLWSYYRMIEQVDAEIGRVLTALEETAGGRETLVLFVADHGEGTAHHRMVRKTVLYDEACTVPLVVAPPGAENGGRRERRLASQVDIVPTICDYVGIAPPPAMRGRSLRPLIENGRPGSSRSFVSAANSDRGWMIRTDRFKYIAYPEEECRQLFDMDADPGETNNLAGDARFADECAAHEKLLAEWESRLDYAPKLAEKYRWS